MSSTTRNAAMTDATDVEVSVPSGGDDAPTPSVDPEPAAAAGEDASATAVSAGAGAGAGAGSSSAEAAAPSAIVSLDLHFAIWDNDIPRLEALLATGRYGACHFVRLVCGELTTHR